MLCRALLLILLFVTLPAWGAENTTFFHEPYSYAVPERPVRIRAVISDRKKINRVTCIVAEQSEVLITMALEEGSRFIYSAMLPPQPAGSTKLRYYFHVQLENGESRSKEYTTPIRQSMIVPGWQPEPVALSQKLNAQETATEPVPPTPGILPKELPPAVTVPEPPPRRFSFSASLETYAASYLKNKTGADRQYGEIRLLPKVGYYNGRNLLFYLQGDIRLDSVSEAHWVMNDTLDRTGIRKVVDIRETYIETSESLLRLRIGKQMYDWSVTDTATVADNLNPRDWNDLIRWERVGVPSLDVQVGTDSFVQAVYVPWFVPSHLPPANGSLSPPPQPGITPSNQKLPSPSSGQVGVRTGAVLNGIDLGASFYSGYNFSPAARVTPTSPVSALLTPYYRRMDVYGLSGARELYGYNVRLETGYFTLHDGDKFFQFIGGVDREWSTLLRQTDSLYLLLQYADETIVHRGIAPLLFDFRRVFTKNVLSKMKYSFDDTREWNLKLEGSYNFRDKDTYLQPAIAWKQNNLEIELGFDLFAGPSASFFGAYGANDRGYLLGRYQF